MKTLFSSNTKTHFSGLDICFVRDYALSQSMKNENFSDILVKWDTRTVQSDKVCKECLDHIANFSFWCISFRTEIQN